ncbi:hypothetical protein B5M42_014625 [Paenibacillus athensensis]|uniref:Uncharacterized protein n=1 Tax=Paenibacillus athensensis TaxID=1967502 RepID=A0A4Y8Q9I6_9BACL|nr:hypothetical protein [Paenibacillus athensensis]MCD1260046.1 hypothetical protein [Paenibacillus athensensis]
MGMPRMFDGYAFADYSGAGPDRQQRKAIAWAVAGRLSALADSGTGTMGTAGATGARGATSATGATDTTGTAGATGAGGADSGLTPAVALPEAAQSGPVGEASAPARLAEEVKAAKGFTRQTLWEEALQLLRAASSASERVLFGFDHNYSFPAGFYDAVTGRAPGSWRELVDWLYATMQDFVENDRLLPRKWAAMHNRLLEQRHGWPVGPFWGPHFQPMQRRFAYTPGNAPYRTGEAPCIRDRRLTELEHPTAKPVFQLGGNGAVGLQSLFGIYYLSKLLTCCAQEGIAVHAWPYDGWTIPQTGHVLIEVYPTLFVPKTERRSDAGDAEACAKWAQKADEGGLLGELLAKPSGLDQAAEDRVRLEGWIAGVKRQG